MQHKYVLYDEKQHPIAVQLPYAEWLHIEKRLASLKKLGGGTDLSKFKGTLKLTVDPVEFQRKIRGEW